MYLLIFLATFVLYIINKNMAFLIVAGLFAIAESGARIANALKDFSEGNVEIIDTVNITDK